MNKQLILGLFSFLVLLQISIPLGMIVKRESVLKTGEEFRFKTAPVDPYDAFRGRYVALEFEASSVSRPEGLELDYNQKVYAQIVVGENGFAEFSTISLTRPSKGKAYMEAEASGYPGEKKVRLRLPIDRYYMEETAAPAAEELYRRHSQRKAQDAYVVVRVKQGFAVIEGLYVGGQRIEDAVKEMK